MAPGFVFEPPSDEEHEVSLSEEEEEEHGEDPHQSQQEQQSTEYENEEDDNDDEVKVSKKKTQSPWDFAKYTDSVAQEHAQRNTTSIDFKISKALENLPYPITQPDDEDSKSSEGESSKEEDQIEEDEFEDEDVGGDAVESKPFFEPTVGVSYHANSFMELNLSRPLLRACEALGYSKPTPIQAACIPLALMGRDICGSAITGSGKTAAFALPTLERLLLRPKGAPQAIRVLILTPTRELAVQIHSMIGKIAQFTDIRCCLVVGGLSSKDQEANLRKMPDIVVATPGRMVDHLCNSMSVDLDDLGVLILDEADRLLELGFSAEINEIVRRSSKRRQTMLFSATMTEEIDELVKLSLSKPVRLSADPSTKRPAKLTEEVVRIRRMREANQDAVLLSLCSKTFTSRVIIFSGTKQAAHRLKIIFGLAGLKSAELHSDCTQAQRLKAIELFRRQQVDFLIATDVAARGLDIIGVETVINFACPRHLNNYVHRVGRTARAGREGYAVTFVTDNDRSLLKSIAKRAGSKLRSRIVAEQSIAKWCNVIEQMEDQISEILEEERVEKIARKAEMEANKAENMIKHAEEIHARPRKTYIITNKEKKLIAKAEKTSQEISKGSGKEEISAQQAEELKMKEKRKREREKHMPRKKRRKLEAAKEMLDDEDEISKGGEKNNKAKAGTSLMDVAYRRAKAVKAQKKALDSGKIVNTTKKKSNRPKTQSRTEEMEQLFHTDIADKKQKRGKLGGGKKAKSSFKSKSRYKRR